MDQAQSNDQFVKHAPCKECGSQDNVAVYADGHGYCFGCKKNYKNYEGPSVNHNTTKKINHNNYTYTKGNRYEIPWSLDFSGKDGQKRKDYKIKKGYDTTTSTLTKKAILSLLLRDSILMKQSKKRSLYVIANGRINL